MLQIDRVCAYYGDVQVLFDISLDVREGEIVSIVGANAAGKSTLLRTISGLLKKTSGAMTFHNKPLRNKPPYEIVEYGIVHIPQGRRVFPMLSVQENLEIGAYSKRKSIDMPHALEYVYALFPNLFELKQRYAGSLSGGEQQMLAIGRGLMAQPRLLTVDEPSLGLAPILVAETFNILRQINQEGVTILLVEQNVVKTLQICDRAYVIENGRIVMQGAGDDLLKDEHLKKAYLGM